MKAFIGYSFAEEDSKVVEEIKNFLISAEIECETGEPAQNRSVATKVKEKISNNDVFIGLFTCGKEICLPRKERKSRGMAFTTSYWVIQEAGFAIAKEKELIFLVENGIPDFPELQGDLEVIYFDRERVNESFQKLNEMVTSIKKRRMKGITSAVAGEKHTNEEQQEVDGKTVEPEEIRAFSEFLDAIHMDKNRKKAKAVYKDKIEGKCSPEHEAFYKAYALSQYYKLGDTEAFNELVLHVGKHPDKPRVIQVLAKHFRDMREYQRSIETIFREENLYDINKGEDKEKIITANRFASSCMLQDNRYEEAIKLMTNLLYKRELEEHKGKIFGGLAELARCKEDWERFFIYAECALEREPADTSLRFNLAYRYSEGGHANLSLLHYKILTDSTTEPAGLNNLGVEYSKLKLPAKSVESYLKSADCKETLAMANLARGYLQGGFVNDARMQINQANKLSTEEIEVDASIGGAQNKLDDMVEEEDSKEASILKEAATEEKFRVKYSEAFCLEKDIDKEKLEGVWETRWGEVTLSFDENATVFSSIQECKVKERAGMLQSAMLGMHSTHREELLIARQIELDGSITKMSGRYKIKVKENSKSILTQGTVYDANGYMIINEDYHTINVMEKGGEEKLSIYQWKKKLTCPHG